MHQPLMAYTEAKKQLKDSIAAHNYSASIELRTMQQLNENMKQVQLQK